MTSTKSNAFDRLSRSQLFDSFSTRQKKIYSSSKKSTLKSNATPVSKEYCFEEAEDGANRGKSKPNSKVAPRSKSRSSNTSPIGSIVDKTKKATSSENVKLRLNKEKSRDKSFGKQGSKFFPESSKKLSILDSSLDNGHKFKYNFTASNSSNLFSSEKRSKPLLELLKKKGNRSLQSLSICRLN